jgi:hypothetical protein
MSVASQQAVPTLPLPPPRANGLEHLSATWPQRDGEGKTLERLFVIVYLK